MTGSEGTIRKIMSASSDEFCQSLGVLMDRPVTLGELPLRVDLEAGHVEIAREEMAGVRLGGLLEMPRATVTLTFAGVPEPARADFVRRFDFAFQRGGG